MYRSKNIYKVLFFLILSVFAACSETEEIKEPSKIDTTSVLLEPGAFEKTISFYAGGDWTASLSNTSWIQLDPTTKVGTKGDAEVKFTCRANEGTAERRSNLTIRVNEQESFVIEIKQLPKGPYLIVDSEDLAFTVDPLIYKRGAFTARAKVTSNSQWELKNLPEWISYYSVNDKQPVEGVSTQIELVFEADLSKFDRAEMTHELMIASTVHSEVVRTLTMTATSTISTQDLSGAEAASFVMFRSPAAANGYMAEMIVESNTGWSINKESLPEWLQLTVANNDREYASSLLTKKAVKLFFNSALLDTDLMNAEVILENTTLGLQHKVNIIFPGTGEDYYESLLFIPSDFEFSASRWDQNWQPVPGAVLDLDFAMLSGKDYKGLSDAPFNIYLIAGQNGFTLKEKATWAGVDHLGESAQEMRSPLSKHDFVLWVTQNTGARREAYVVITPKEVTFDDLFLNEEGDLKPEYDEKKTHFAQQGVATSGFECAIEDNYVSFAKGADQQLFEIFKTPEMIFTNMYGHEWLSVDFKRDNTGKLSLVVDVKENTTGQPRSQEVVIYEYVSDFEPEKVIYTFLVEQAGE